MQLSFPTLLQNELKSDVARFPTHVQTCQQPEWVQDMFDEGGKTFNVALQFVLQQCCKQVAHFCHPFFRTFSTR